MSCARHRVLCGRLLLFGGCGGRHPTSLPAAAPTNRPETTTIMQHNNTQQQQAYTRRRKEWRTMAVARSVHLSDTVRFVCRVSLLLSLSLSVCLIWLLLQSVSFRLSSRWFPLVGPSHHHPLRRRSRLIRMESRHQESHPHPPLDARRRVIRNRMDDPNHRRQHQDDHHPVRR